MTGTRCRYQSQDSMMTLREGIDEYHKANPHLLFPSTIDEEAAKFFRCHDRIHVVFGCGTSFLHEVRADFWTFFGSDVGMVKYLSFLKSPAIRLLMKDIKQKIEKGPTIRDNMRVGLKRSACAAMAAPVQVLARTRKMRKRWPWIESEGFLDRTLKEIRDDYGITVFQ